MKIIITEEQKKKLFTPRGLSNDENNRYLKLNLEQPVKIIGGEEIRVNQYDLDGNKTGYWEEYHNNGKLWAKGNYISGKKEGIWEYYYKNGELSRKGNYIDGKKNGFWEEYHNNGKLWYKGSFKNGSKDGYYEVYYDNGELCRKELYKGGYKMKDLPITESEQPKKKLFIPRNIESRYEQWNKEQPIIDGIRINQYDLDGRKQGIWVKYYDNGEIFYKGNYVNGKPDGIWEKYYKDGKLDDKGSYVDGVKEGYWEAYWTNGNLRYKGSYINDEKDGIWEEWFYDGEFWYEGLWDNGKYVRDIRI